MTENKPKKERMTEEVANKEFENFADAWDIDSNTDAMNSEDKDSFDEQKKRIVNALIKGRVSIAGNGNLTYNLVGEEGPDSFEFKIPKGDAYLNMDKYKDRQAMHKMFGVLANMAGTSSKMFSNIDARDTKSILCSRPDRDLTLACHSACRWACGDRAIGRYPLGEITEAIVVSAMQFLPPKFVLAYTLIGTIALFSWRMPAVRYVLRNPVFLGSVLGVVVGSMGQPDLALPVI